MEDLIMNAHILFDEQTNHNSPPLPATPAGEIMPTYAYGTSHTRVASVPPALNLPRSPPEDFTPRLPPRPANSIHPSLRANPASNPASPTRGRADIPPPLPLRSVPAPEDDVPPSPSVISSTAVDSREETEETTLHDTGSLSADTAPSRPSTSRSSSRQSARTPSSAVSLPDPPASESTHPESTDSHVPQERPRSPPFSA